jgi:hypothetical protein
VLTTFSAGYPDTVWQRVDDGVLAPRRAVP